MATKRSLLGLGADFGALWPCSFISYPLDRKVLLLLLIDLFLNLFALKSRIHAAQKDLLIRTNLVCILFNGALLR